MTNLNDPTQSERYADRELCICKHISLQIYLALNCFPFHFSLSRAYYQISQITMLCVALDFNVVIALFMCSCSFFSTCIRGRFALCCCCCCCACCVDLVSFLVGCCKIANIDGRIMLFRWKLQFIYNK